MTGGLSVSTTDRSYSSLGPDPSQISNLCFAVAGAFMVERMGRRPLWFISTGGMLVCMIVVTALSATFLKDDNAAVGGAVVAFLYLFYGVSEKIRPLAARSPRQSL